jgi:hypothetical protein
MSELIQFSFCATITWFAFSFFGVFRNEFAGLSITHVCQAQMVIFDNQGVANVD